MTMHLCVWVIKNCFPIIFVNLMHMKLFFIINFQICFVILKQLYEVGELVDNLCNTQESFNII